MKGWRWIFVLFVLTWCSVTQGQTNLDFLEKVDFSIPKTVYFTGEKIWIDVKVEAERGPTPSRIVYVELWNRYNESVALAKLPLQSGRVLNFLQIPDQLPSDQYLLRVFTRGSPSQDPDMGLVQEFVSVFNPRIPPVVVAQRPSKTSKASSPALSISTEIASPGEEFTVSYTGVDSLLELTVAVPNPFLEHSGKLLSSELYEEIPKRKSVPELFGHIIEAKVLADDSNESGIYYLSLHGEKSVLLTDKIDENGSIYFDAGGLRHWDFMVAQGKGNPSMNNFEIVPLSPQTRFKADFEFPLLQISPADEPLLKELLKGSQIGGYFTQNFHMDPIPVVTGFVEDRTFELDDYTRFDDLETHIREYVPEVIVRARGKNKELRVLNALQDRSFSDAPLILLDAMPVLDVESLLKFNPQKIKSLQVITRPFYLNAENYSGVISLSSFENDFGGFPLSPNAIYLPYAGLQAPITESRALFQSPDDKAAVMDWRTILYWFPEVDNTSSGRTISLTAPLLKGVFRATIKTLGPDGKIAYSYAEFEVI